ncbi:copalyl diphosphate synthase 2-like [Selaginella moellendorffii]|uniref:copalyl diphosphate synthase 2-like n=1 Tax=Selaginella moellendorffii TaxID=88036 RepID=UPI000D1C4E0D|nr:copalyl diphosphate synthase 2-like [Selaginella moellendorffii]|eukprot:XP_024536913.1 copalyl diphosphate synthase 2-like [Selaginella moellendorffii]
MKRKSSGALVGAIVGSTETRGALEVFCSSLSFANMLMCKVLPNIGYSTALNATFAPPNPKLERITRSTVSEDVKRKRRLELVDAVRTMFRSLGDGNISRSAYDTAWVARVPALDGSNSPQFPMCLDWIIKNQFEDGSWGDKDLFFTYERVCSTLACVISLKIWNTQEKHIEKGLEFIRRTMPALETEESAHMLIGFEIVFPAMLDEAMELGLDLDYSSPVVHKFHAEREKKLQRISLDVLQTHPTPLLYSVEGLHKSLDWHKVVKLQCSDGSLLSSPSSTACALMYTGNEKCLQYLNNILERYKDAVPNTYPVDLFEHIWIVDRIERLGIARYFTREIKDALDYVYRNWTDKGISWARGTPIQDGDDTSMGFMVLRSHGYDVSADVFKHFQHENEHGFFCFVGQVSEAVTGMLDLYKATKVMFPGDVILQKARAFTRSFLDEKRRKGELNDKWVVTKDLPGEVEFELDNPFHATVERIATRSYIDQYGVDDVWIGKSLYRMPFVNNPVFLELAKLDFNTCQAFHKQEFKQLERWYAESSFRKFGCYHRDLEQSFFGAAAIIFEPELATARVVWSKCSFIASVIAEYFRRESSIVDLQDLLNGVQRWDPSSMEDSSDDVKLLFIEIFLEVESQSKQCLNFQGRSVNNELRRIWSNWLSSLLEKTRWRVSKKRPTLEDHLKASKSDVEPAVYSTMYFVKEKLAAGKLYQFSKLCTVMNSAITLEQDLQDFFFQDDDSRLNSVSIYLEEKPGTSKESAVVYIRELSEELMRELLRESLCCDDNLPSACKHLFLNGARLANFMVAARRELSMDGHIHRLLSQPF